MKQHALHSDHSRRFEHNKFVYPVLSRRSRGISVGVNLNPDKVCNFDCIYCQVDRRSESDTRFVEQSRLLAELEATLLLCRSGDLYQLPQFATVPAPLRRLNDIAFSGDGEPTTYRNFDELMEISAAVKSRLGLNDVKMVLITNASMFHRPHVRRGLETLDRNQGEIWAKLDAGTDAYYHLIERTKIPFQQVLDNIQHAACIRPLVIQTLFMKVHGEPPTTAEYAAYCQRLNAILRQGGEIQRVQIYTVARPPAESFVTSLSSSEVDAVSQLVRQQTGLPVESFYGTA